MSSEWLHRWLVSTHKRLLCKTLQAFQAQAEKHSFRPVTSISRRYHSPAIEPVRHLEQSSVETGFFWEVLP